MFGGGVQITVKEVLMWLHAPVAPPGALPCRHHSRGSPGRVRRRITHRRSRGSFPLVRPRDRRRLDRQPDRAAPPIGRALPPVRRRRGGGMVGSVHPLPRGARPRWHGLPLRQPGVGARRRRRRPARARAAAVRAPVETASCGSPAWSTSCYSAMFRRRPHHLLFSARSSRPCPTRGSGGCTSISGSTTRAASSRPGTRE
jgi:hypothetical protein